MKIFKTIKNIFNNITDKLNKNRMDEYFNFVVNSFNTQNNNIFGCFNDKNLLFIVKNLLKHTNKPLYICVTDFSLFFDNENFGYLCQIASKFNLFNLKIYIVFNKEDNQIKMIKKLYPNVVYLIKTINKSYQNFITTDNMYILTNELNSKDEFISSTICANSYNADKLIKIFKDNYENKMEN